MSHNWYTNFKDLLEQENPQKDPNFVEYIRENGIPDQFKEQVWYALTDDYYKQPEVIIKLKKELYIGELYDRYYKLNKDEEGNVKGWSKTMNESFGLIEKDYNRVGINRRRNRFVQLAGFNQPRQRCRNCFSIDWF